MEKNFWRAWAENMVAALGFVACLAAPILSLTFGGAWLAKILARASVQKSDVNEFDRWIGHVLMECKGSRTEQDAWVILYLTAISLSTVRCAHAIAQSQFLLVRNVWPHTFGGVVSVTLGGWLIARETFENVSPIGTLVFIVSFLFSCNVVGSTSRRLAQFRASTHRKRAKHLARNVCQDIAVALVKTTMMVMSWLYLIASERTSGSMDVLINGVLYPASCAGFRVLLHKINQKALRRKQNQDHERLLEVAALTSSYIVSF